MNEKFFKIFVTYVIKPNDLVKNSKGKKLVDDLKSYLKKEFKFKQDLNNNNIIKENKRIVERNINITNKIEKKEYKYYNRHILIYFYSATLIFEKLIFFGMIFPRSI